MFSLRTPLSCVLRVVCIASNDVYDFSNDHDLEQRGIWCSTREHTRLIMQINWSCENKYYRMRSPKKDMTITKYSDNACQNTYIIVRHICTVSVSVYTERCCTERLMRYSVSGHVQQIVIVGKC